jgi:nicotinate dehydrogenase subunit B
MNRPAHQTEQDVRRLDASIVGAFLELAPDGVVTVYSGKVELGTGIETALAQIVAEELGVPFDHVRVVMGDTALTPDQGVTAGSKSIQVAGPVLRRAAAEARRELLDRAADILEVSPHDLLLRDGVVLTVDGTASMPIGDLAGKPFSRTIPEADHTSGSLVRGLIGQPVPRVDLLAKLTSGEAFVHDARLHGMLHGRVIRPYVRTTNGSGLIVEVNDREARAMPGVVAVVRNGDFLGVVAEREEDAIRAAEAVRVVWAQDDPLPMRDDLHDRMRAEDAQDTEPLHRGDVDAAMRSADRTMTATYRFPMQGHASMGPSRIARRSTPAPKASTVSATHSRLCSGWTRTESGSSFARARDAMDTTAPMMSPPTLRCSRRRSADPFGCNGCAATSSHGSPKARRCS